MKKLFSHLRTGLLGVCLLIICGFSLRANAEVIDVPIEVTFDQVEARKMLQYVNDFRTGNEAWYWNEDNTEKVWVYDLQTLEYDYNLEKVAMQRAAEVALYMDGYHRRADGQRCFATYSDLGYEYYWAGENVTYSTSPSWYNAYRATDSLKESDFSYLMQGHRRNMLDSKWTVCAFGCVISNGNIYYTQEFANENESISYVYTAPDTSTRVCYSKATYDDDNPLYIDPIVLFEGETLDLSTVPVNRAYFDDFNEKQVRKIAVSPSYSVGDSSIAKINGNTLTALKAGSSTPLTAKFNIKGKEYTAKTTVSVVSLTIDKEEAVMKPNETLQLNAKITGSKDLKLKWSSSNDSIATVNDKGLVTSQKTGRVKITAQVSDSNKSVSCWIDVRIPVESISLSATTIKCKENDEFTLSLSRYPDNTTDNDTVSWTIKDKNGQTIAYRIMKPNGYSSRTSDGAISFVDYSLNEATFKAVKTGKATIIVTVGDQTAECSVTVSDSNQGQTSDLQEEQVKAFVTRFYTLILNREPDETGINYWTQILLNKEQTGAQVAFGFVNSPEFTEEHPVNDTEFVKRMYAAFFDRDGGADGEAWWLGYLNQGYTRNYVLAGFTNSDEFKNLCAQYGIDQGSLPMDESMKNNPNPSPQPHVDGLNIDASNVDPAKLDEYIDRLYRLVLKREPEAEGKQYWREEIIKGNPYNASTAAEIGFFNSPEYLALNKTDEDFIRDCYLVFLNREPEDGGFEYWKEKFRTGEYDRQKLIEVGVGHSNEFKDILRSYGFVIIE